MIKYITYSISIAFISWIVGMIVNALLIKTAYYHNNLSNLNFIKSKRLNKSMGMGIFKWIVKNTFFKFFNPKLKLKNKIEITELDTLRKEMTISEISHLIAFVTVAAFALVKSINGQYLLALVMIIVNIVMNLYPSLLQQENKRRIDRFTKSIAGKNFAPGSQRANYNKYTATGL